MLDCLAIMLVAAGASAEKTAQLEYRFNVGEELVYEHAGKENLLKDEEESDRRYETKARWNIYPIRRNEDGSWRLVVRTWVKLLRYDREESDDRKLGPWKQEPYVRFENTHLGYCDLAPNGSYTANPTLGYSYFFMLLPELLFKPLPLAGLAGEATPRVAPTSGTTYTLRAHPLANGTARLTGPLVRTTSANYEATNTLDIDFDAAAGRVQQIIETSESKRKDHPSHHRTTYHLVDIVQRSPAWMTKFESATETYFRHRGAWWKDKSQTQKMRTEDACRQLVENARRRLVAGQTAIDNAEVRSAYDGLIALHDREAEWDIEAAAERSSREGMQCIPSPSSHRTCRFPASGGPKAFRLLAHTGQRRSRSICSPRC